MGVPFTAGERLTAADLNVATGQFAWISYAPTWTTSGGSNPTIGNGTLLGYYMKIGRLVVTRINIIGGSTTNWGTGASYRLGLPFAAITQTGAEWEGSWHAIRTGVANRAGVAYITSGATGVGALIDNSGTDINPTNPVTWATIDTMTFQIAYETAS
jgi:hypothetical protein